MQAIRKPGGGNVHFCQPLQSERRTQGEGLTTEKMKECRWLKQVLVGQFEFVEWTPDGHLRHDRFMGLREDQ
jgi:ATP-dependent DNA ligase